MNAEEFNEKVKKLTQESGFPTLPGTPFALEEVTVTLRLPKFIARIPELTAYLESTPNNSLGKCPTTFTSLIEEAVIGSMVKDKAMFQALLIAFALWHFKIGADGDKA